MACPDSTAAADALAAAIAGPAQVTSDGLTVIQHRLDRLIAADKYQAAKCAARDPRRGLRFTRLVPPGAT